MPVLLNITSVIRNSLFSISFVGTNLINILMETLECINKVLQNNFSILTYFDTTILIAVNSYMTIASTLIS